MGNLDPASLFLLACLRVDPAHPAQIRSLLQSGLDWEALQALAMRHGLFPLLYTCLREDAPGLVPESVLARLREYYIQNSLRNLRMAQRLIQVITLFEQAGIASLPFKGPVTALQAYGNLNARAYADLDLLIKPGDLSEALNILQTIGYLPAVPIQPGQLPWLQRGYKEVELRRADQHLDLHWDLINARLRRFPQDRFSWQDHSQIILLGKEIPTLSPKNTLLYLCLHGAGHAWQPVSMVADLSHFLVRHPELDWHALGEAAERYDMQRAFGLGLLLAKDWSYVALPPEMEHFTAGAEVQHLAERVQRSWFAAPGEENRLVDESFQLHCQDNLPARIYYTYHLVFSAQWSELQAMPLPVRLYPFYHFLRPMRLVLKYGKQALRRIKSF
jgi:hypothetical protein